MGFVKVVKNKAYFKRYQVKFKRRRQNKTDYQQRKKLIIQDKNKYQTPKYRFVVRITNADVVCQIFSSDLTHDACLASAYAHELSRYGLTVGLTNYAAAYATGLLLARRVNKKFNLDFDGKTEIEDPEEWLNYSVYEDYDDEGSAPFEALLDVGLKRTTTGARVFAALKGAVDGGLAVPHGSGRFAGTKSLDDESNSTETDPEILRHYIFGGHVGDYMRVLKEKDEEKFQKQFSQYVKLGLGPDDLEDLYENVHKAIRADPAKARASDELGNKNSRTQARKQTYPAKRWNRAKLSLSQRRARIKQVLLAKGDAIKA
jgi:large subunit ribosomal protein L5e